MASDIIVKLSRSDLEGLDVPAGITDVRHLSSYSWIEEGTPTIIVPGLPPLWNPPPGSRKLEKDSGFVYIAENAARHPEYPAEPLLRSLFITHPSFDLRSVDVITDRNSIRRLLQFVQPDRTSYNLEAFSINIEVRQNTIILGRTETANSEVIGPNDFRGYGHQFECEYTTAEIKGSSGHQRILSYRFCGMNFIVRHETDGYVGTEATGHKEMQGDSLSNFLDNLSLKTDPNEPYPTIAQSKLNLRRKGHVVHPESIIEIKTRTEKKPLDINEIAPQLWISQTPKLVRAYHVGGKFLEPSVEDVSAKIQLWEATNQPDLMKLGWLVKKIIAVAKDSGGKVLVKYDVAEDELSIRENEAGNMLPENLYARWNVSEASHEANRGVGRPDCRIGIDEAREAETMDANVGLLPPTQEGFTASEHENVFPDHIPFADVVRSGTAKGFLQVFREMPLNLKDYQVLCESFMIAEIDVLNGRQVRDLMGDMRRGKDDWDPEERRKISGSKAIARNSAFRLIYAFLKGQVKDSNTAYNATVFVVSHFRIFGYRIRKMVREAFEYKFVPSIKQRRGLDNWPMSGDSQEDDATTEEDDDFSPWDSDCS